VRRRVRAQYAVVGAVAAGAVALLAGGVRAALGRRR